MPTPTKLQVEHASGVTVATFAHESILDAETVKGVREALYALLANPPERPLVLDLQNVRFLSSQALGMLLALRKKSADMGVQVVLAAVRPELARILEITNLNALFPSFETREAAIAELANDR